eukprot:359820-Chlamydomonas_euryale.AAC.1
MHSARVAPHADPVCMMFRSRTHALHWSTVFYHSASLPLAPLPPRLLPRPSLDIAVASPGFPAGCGVRRPNVLPPPTAFSPDALSLRPAFPQAAATAGPRRRDALGSVVAGCVADLLCSYARAFAAPWATLMADNALPLDAPADASEGFLGGGATGGTTPQHRRGTSVAVDGPAGAAAGRPRHRRLGSDTVAEDLGNLQKQPPLGGPHHRTAQSTAVLETGNGSVPAAGDVLNLGVRSMVVANDVGQGRSRWAGKPALPDADALATVLEVRGDCMCERLHARVCEHVHVQVHERVRVRVRERVCVCGCASMCTCGCVSGCTCRCTSVCVCGCVSACACAGARACACAGARACACAGARACAHAGA